MSEGLQLQIWDCNDLSQQSWGYDSYSGHVYLAASVTDASLCMDLDGNNQVSGTPIMVYGCSEYPQQSWSVVDAEWYGSPGLKSTNGANLTQVQQMLVV